MQALNKIYLSRAIKLLLSCFILAFLYVLFKMATWSPQFNLANELSAVLESDTRLVSLKGKRYWVTKLSKNQRKQMDDVDTYVHQVTVCDESDFCLIDSSTLRQGVIIRFALEKPQQLNLEQEWFGGFINPANGAVYDLKGRGYLTNSQQASKTISTILKD